MFCLFFKNQFLYSNIQICIHKNRGEKSQYNWVFWGRGEKTTTSGCARPRRKFHGKMPGWFSVVCGGVGCALWVTLHHSTQSALFPDGSEVLKSYWIGHPGGPWGNTDGTCGSWSCVTRRQPAPWLQKDGSNSFYLAEFKVYRRKQVWKQTSAWDCIKVKTNC